MTGHDPGRETPRDLPGGQPPPEIPEELAQAPAEEPARRRRRWPAVVIALIAAAAVVLGGLQYLPVLLSGSTETDPVPTPAATPIPQPSTTTPAPATENGGGTPFTATAFLTTMNEALADRDRATFFDHVGPGAVDGLNLWWDNMTQLGMSGGGMSVESGSLEGLGPGGSADLTVRLGAITLGTPRAGADSEYAETGQYLVAAAQYEITVSVSAAGDARITGWRTTDPVKPWDEGPLTAVQTEHVLVAGADTEAHLLEEYAGLAEEPATWVLDRYADATGGGAPIDRFTVFLTDDAERAADWFDTGGGNEELAGFTIPMLRLGRAPGLDPRIATDEQTPWGSNVVTVGPGGLESPQAFRSLAAHELTHAVDFAWLPVPQDRSRVISEGWAEYLQELWDSNGVFAPPDSWRGQRIQECLADGWDYPTDADFDTEGADIFCAYALSASVYAYAAELGLDPFQLARQARSSGQPLTEVSAQLGGPTVTQDGWDDWVRSTYR